MAFLDNSGDIILDAVLTDTGRYRLAKGDGSFRIAKFALADDEINYELFNKTHASGSAYYDLEILQTPCLEAFTNNASSVKHRLLSLPRTNLLYLPVMKVNDKDNRDAVHAAVGAHVVCVDKDTEEVSQPTGTEVGVLYGENPGSQTAAIRVDQGLDTSELPPSQDIDADLVETQYLIQMDNRLGRIVSAVGTTATAAKVSFIDDDNIATYYLSSGTDDSYVSNNGEKLADASGQVILGPRGTTLQFKIRSSIELNTSTYLFEKMGNLGASAGTGLVMTLTNGGNAYWIDSTVRVIGATTGFSLDIPVRFVKKQ